MVAARVQPCALLVSMRPARVSPACRLARPPVRPRRQAVRCTAEPLQAAADGATQLTATPPAAAAAFGSGLGSGAVAVIGLVAAYFFIWKPLAARKKASQDHERMKVRLAKSGYPPHVLARLKATTPNGYAAAVKAAGSEQALLTKWTQQGPQVGSQHQLLTHAERAWACAGRAGRQVA